MRIPYGRQWISEDDIEKVIEVLKSDYLTTGPVVQDFERAFAKYVGARYAVSVANGTAALHLALASLEIGPGDEVIIPAFTMIATAFAVVYTGATPVPSVWRAPPPYIDRSESPSQNFSTVPLATWSAWFDGTIK